MARSLAPRGVAVFDLNSLLAYRTTFASYDVTTRGDLVRPSCRAVLVACPGRGRV
jgi:hypothetical protein